LNKQSRRRAAQAGVKGIGDRSAFAPAELASVERRFANQKNPHNIAATGGLAPPDEPGGGGQNMHDAAPRLSGQNINSRGSPEDWRPTLDPSQGHSCHFFAP